MTTITIVTPVIISGSGAVTAGTDSDDWYCKDLVAYVLLAAIGVAMVIIIVLVCLCCWSRRRGKQL